MTTMKEKQTTLNFKITNVCLTFICLLFVNISFSQRVEVLQQSGLKNLPEGKKYAFIEPSTDTSDIKFVATIYAKDKNRKSNIEAMYFGIREKANKLGANCYRLKSFTRDTLNSEAVLILDSYVAPDTVLSQNKANHEKNVVFVFGNEREGDKTMSFHLNGETKEIKSGTYYKISLEEGKDIKVSKGGTVGGAWVWLGWEKDKQPDFFSLSGFGLMDWSEQQRPSMFNQGSSIGFHTGGINRIGNISLGLLLTQLLKQGNL